MGYILFANYLDFPDFIVPILEKMVNYYSSQGGFPLEPTLEIVNSPTLEILNSPLLQGEPDVKCPDNDIFVRIYFFL